MAANITIIRAAVRKDLHDEDAANYRWTDAVLDRHIQHAVLDYSLESPLAQKSTVATVAGSRDLNLSALTNRIDIERIEWPTTLFPPAYVAWAEHVLGTVTMDVVSPPSAIENAHVYWWKTHTIDGSTSDIPAAHDDIIATGAAGYAALDRDVFAIDKINTGGQDVWGRYHTFGLRRLDEFKTFLRQVGRSGRLRQRKMYTTDAPSVFEQNRVKY